jgi:DNA-binding response OmpR family regulator
MDDSILILLVEDEALIRMHLEAELAEAGFALVVAANGVEAMVELGIDATRFRAVLTDIRIGGDLDGWDVARHARELKPEIPVIYISGDSGHEWPVKGVPGSVMVAKPFATAQIITAVSMVLNQADVS